MRNLRYFGLLLVLATSCSNRASQTGEILVHLSSADEAALKSIAPELNENTQTALLAEDVSFLKSQDLVTTTEQEKAIAAFQKQ